MQPKQVLESWIKAFNSADIEALVSLYHDDAVNHQVVDQPVRGLSAIREMFTREFAAAKMVCIRENIFEDGDWAIMEWRDPKGLRGCGFFHIREGRIAFQRGYWGQALFPETARPAPAAFGITASDELTHRFYEARH